MNAKNLPDCVRWACVGLALLAFSTSPANAADDEHCNPNGSNDNTRSRLQAHEPSYAVFRQSKGDENAVQFKYSLRYDLRPERRSNYEVYLKYTGAFDFYMGTRPSSPVVNRLSNIGLHFQCKPARDLSAGGWHMRSYDIGVEHRSNGQTFDVASEPAYQAARQAYTTGDHRFFDRISRGANYVSAEIRARQDNERAEAPGLTLSLKSKLYFTSDNDVRWGPQDGKNLDISDFDRLTVGLTYRSRATDAKGDGRFSLGDQEAGLYWTVGDRGPKTSSLDMDFMQVLRHRPSGVSLPLYLRVHWGPMNTLSDYSRRQTSIGVGVRFLPDW